MLNKKKGFPSEGECVFCTVSKVQYNSVFANLDEYERKSGMIHISEISPGRIRNIRDYVKEGKVVICKVLRINKERGHIDLSLRRVNESQRRAKVEERKQEGIAENILKSYAKQNDVKLFDIYKTVSDILLKKYDSLYLAFEDVVENGASLEDIGLDADIAQKLDVIIRERIKPKEVEIEALLQVSSFESNGVDIVNEFMDKLSNISDLLHLQFLGAGKFKIEVKAPDYEEAEKVMDSIQKIIDITQSSLTQITLTRD